MPSSSDKAPNANPAIARSPANRKPPTKSDRLLALLKRKGGQDMNQLAAALGWLPHTVRAALSRLRKAGVNVERSSGAGGRARYHIGAGAGR